MLVSAHVRPCVCVCGCVDVHVCVCVSPWSGTHCCTELSTQALGYELPSLPQTVLRAREGKRVGELGGMIEE